MKTVKAMAGILSGAFSITGFALLLLEHGRSEWFVLSVVAVLCLGTTWPIAYYITQEDSHHGK